MGHSVAIHYAAYSRWCGDEVVDGAFAKAARLLAKHRAYLQQLEISLTAGQSFAVLQSLEGQKSSMLSTLLRQWTRLTGKKLSDTPACSWRPSDAEALRIALSIPVSAPSLSALNREMALLQTPYPTGVCTAQRHLDAIAGLDQQLAVVDYATELLLEETDTEWNPAGPSPAHRQPVGSAPCCAPVASTAALRQRPPLPV